jgi:uncharacterized membrane protein affecting hemolysin expression
MVQISNRKINVAVKIKLIRHKFRVGNQSDIIMVCSPLILIIILFLYWISLNMIYTDRK